MHAHLLRIFCHRDIHHYFDRYYFCSRDNWLSANIESRTYALFVGEESLSNETRDTQSTQDKSRVYTCFLFRKCCKNYSSDSLHFGIRFWSTYALLHTRVFLCLSPSFCLRMKSWLAYSSAWRGCPATRLRNPTNELRATKNFSF